MLPRYHRLHRSADFATVVRRGARKGRRTMVVHAHVDSSEIRVGGPRFGLVVSKAVGDSVTRHRVSRRLRHLAAGLLDGLEPDLLVVIRANPAAAEADAEELGRDLAAALPVAAQRAREQAAGDQPSGERATSSSSPRPPRSPATGDVPRGVTP